MKGSTKYLGYTSAYVPSIRVPKSHWDTTESVDNNRAKILWDFKLQNEKQPLAERPDIEEADKKSTAIDDRCGDPC